MPLSLHPEAQANSTSNTTCWLRLGATQMHEAVAEIAMVREITRLGATLAAESTVDILSRRLCPYCMRAQPGVALVKLIAWYYVNINMDTPSSPPGSALGPEDAPLPPASQTYRLYRVLPFRWLNCFQLLLLYHRLPASCAPFLKVCRCHLSESSCGVPRQQL